MLPVFASGMSGATGTGTLRRAPASRPGDACRPRRQFAVALLALPALGFVMAPAHALSESEAVFGVRAALERGANVAVGLLGRSDGFLGNPSVRIELPGFLSDGARLLRAAGQGRRVDDLVAAMNHAAEAAVPQARTLLVSAAKSMSVEDALQIVRGGDTAVTEFFSRKTRVSIGEKFLPIVGRATAKLSLAKKYDAVAGRAASLGLVTKGQADLNGYVTGKALDGLYFMIGEEERKIRRDPRGAGSEILKRVFGS